MDAWTGILDSLKLNINPLSFETWLKPCRMLPSSNGKMRIQVPNAEFESWIRGNWASEIAKLARQQGFHDVQYYPEIQEPKEQNPREGVEPEPDEEAPSQRRSTDSTQCPHAPEEAWYGLASTYRSVIATRVESSDNFHLACFVTLVGSLLGKSVFINRGKITYPNFYTVIVGDSAWSAKGTAMQPIEELAEQINPAVIPLTSLDSSEGLIRAIEDSRRASGLGTEGCVLVVIDELNAMLEKAKMKGSKLIPDLKKAFDSPKVLEINTSKRSRVPNAPTISIMAASETEDLADMRDRDLYGGMGNRWIFIPGNPKPLNYESSMPAGDDWSEIVGDLRKVVEFYQRRGKTELRFRHDAYPIWKKFYNGCRERGSDDHLIAKLAARHRAYVPRVALVFAALDRETEFIQPKQLSAAVALADFLLESLYHVFRNADVKPWVRESKDIIDYVTRKGGVKLRPLRNRFHRLGAETFERRMKYLLADEVHPERELRKEERVGSSGRISVWVVPNE